MSGLFDRLATRIVGDPPGQAWPRVPTRFEPLPEEVGLAAPIATAVAEGTGPPIGGGDAERAQATSSVRPAPIPSRAIDAVHPPLAAERRSGPPLHQPAALPGRAAPAIPTAMSAAPPAIQRRVADSQAGPSSGMALPPAPTLSSDGTSGDRPASTPPVAPAPVAPGARSFAIDGSAAADAATTQAPAVAATGLAAASLPGGAGLSGDGTTFGEPASARAAGPAPAAPGALSSAIERIVTADAATTQAPAVAANGLAAASMPNRATAVDPIEPGYAGMPRATALAPDVDTQARAAPAGSGTKRAKAAGAATAIAEHSVRLQAVALPPDQIAGSGPTDRVDAQVPQQAATEPVAGIIAAAIPVAGPAAGAGVSGVGVKQAGPLRVETMSIERAPRTFDTSPALPQPSAHAGAVPAPALSAQPAAPSIVEVHIGSVEIRAAPPPAIPTAPAGPAARSLDDFLAGRRAR